MSQDPHTRARALLERSARAYAAERFADALAASQQAVEILRDLADRQFEFYALELIDGLKALAPDLEALDRWRDADEVREEIAARYRELLDGGHPVRGWLAEALQAWADAAEPHAPERAHAMRREAVEHYRLLVEDEGPDYTGPLADALDTLANGLGWSQRHACLAAQAEAVALYRRLAEQDAARWTAPLAESLKQSVHQRQMWSLGEPAAVEADAEETVALFRTLAADAPEDWTEELIDALGLLAQGMPASRALAWTAEAVAQARALDTADARPLAEALELRAIALRRAGDAPGVIAAHDEIVAMHRALAEDHSEQHLSGLAVVLDQRAEALLGLDRPAEALPSVDEAVGIFRGLVAMDAGWLRDLMLALEYRRDILMALDRPAAARAPAEEAVACGRRRLETAAGVDEQADVWTRAELHRAEAGLAEVLLALGETDAAARAADAAFDTLWPDLDGDPDRVAAWLKPTVALRAKIGGDDGGRAARFAAAMATEPAQAADEK